MKLFHMVFYKCRFKRVAAGLDRAVEVDRLLGPKGTGTGDFVKKVGPVKICVYDDSPKVHVSTLLFRLSALNLNMFIITIKSTPLKQKKWKWV